MKYAAAFPLKLCALLAMELWNCLWGGGEKEARGLKGGRKEWEGEILGKQGIEIKGRGTA